jgi:AcrR family transcriptional regulator
MPRGFTEREKAIIRADLLSRGADLFAAHGLKKTNVEDLTRAAGISKGAFYLFYESKEQLFFEIIERIENDYQARLLQAIADEQLPPRERMAKLLSDSVALLHENPLLSQLSREEYEHLFRRLPEEQLRAHLARDAEFASQFVAAWRAAGLEIDASPELISGLIRALFFIGMHAEEFSPGIYPQVQAIYADLLSRYLVE